MCKKIAGETAGTLYQPIPGVDTARESGVAYVHYFESRQLTPMVGSSIVTKAARVGIFRQFAARIHRR